MSVSVFSWELQVSCLHMCANYTYVELNCTHVAGVISWMSVIYLDVVKSRIQADDPTNPRYRSMIDCFRQCYAEGGTRSVSQTGLVLEHRVVC